MSQPGAHVTAGGRGLGRLLHSLPGRTVEASWDGRLVPTPPPMRSAHERPLRLCPGPLPPQALRWQRGHRGGSSSASCRERSWPGSGPGHSAGPRTPRRRSAWSWLYLWAHGRPSRAAAPPSENSRSDKVHEAWKSRGHLLGERPKRARGDLCWRVTYTAKGSPVSPRGTGERWPASLLLGAVWPGCGHGRSEDWREAGACAPDAAPAAGPSARQTTCAGWRPLTRPREARCTRTTRA